jgi:predicted transcriptional regulator
MSNDQKHEPMRPPCDATEHQEFLRRKVEAGMASARIGRGIPNDEVKAEFAAKRAKAQAEIDANNRRPPQR